MATTYTPNYHLGKQEDRSDKFLMSVITDNMDIIDEQLKATDDKATAAAAGLRYKGAVNYYSDLPNDAEIGDAYTVLYAGSSGSVADGTEYVWGELSGTAQWIDFSKDSYTKAEVNTLLAAKQATLTAGTGLSFGTGSAAATLGHSNSTTAQSTQAFRQVAYDAQGHITGSTAATTAQAAAINSGITSTDVEQINTNKNNILLKQNKTWIQLKNVTTATDTFELDLSDKSEVKIVLIYQSNMYEASAPVNLINANYKLIVSQVDSATPNTAIGTLIKNTNDFTATIPSNSYSLRIFAR